MTRLHTWSNLRIRTLQFRVEELVEVGPQQVILVSNSYLRDSDSVSYFNLVIIELVLATKRSTLFMSTRMG
jgi:hypothetical protein